MAAIHLYTLADLAQLPSMFKGKFLKGNPQPRIALVGRSNVGKSTLINALVGSRVAQTSNRPGKTRAIHFYLWNEARKIIADLPGYGYARISKGDRKKWEQFIEAYLDCDSNLERAVVLLDARHGPTEGDERAIEFLNLKGIPVTLVFAKLDTLKNQSQKVQRQKEVALSLEKLRENRLIHGSEEIYWVSSHTQVGLKSLADELCRSTNP